MAPTDPTDLSPPPQGPRRRPAWLNLRVALLPLFLVQTVTALFFVSDIVFSVLGIEVAPINWKLREAMEISAALGLVLGLVFGAQALLLARHEAEVATEKLRRASTAFAELLSERFAEWRLTAAEREVALFAIKGLTLAEIAGLRATSEGTVKAQTASIYRKAGVSTRSQLVSIFIEDLMDEPTARFTDIAPGTIAAPKRAAQGGR
ncbi:helix-turn-helix transcriptional regulator [Rhodobacter capsulatus]|uniref:Helix-turn-helix transcriptional regulator n=1 Tax=Rhodobacter capsulatus TaxID=1061 RepID=A0A4U1JTY6_RHOCA|nr:helix-turn-helix transcriptional regulator [Rhodobacter capsulatus]TKD22567.1 helix-turn-helix transcriptional regulator [Rhodobacter capsulatus]